MKKIIVEIREKDKGARNLSLLNLRDEIVNFLYKDTIASSTKIDLQFFILLYFISIRCGEKIFLEKIFDDGIPKFNKLNEAFTENKGHLRAKQYRGMVEEHGLSELFENDIFFVLVEAILNIKEIENRYAEFFKKHIEIRDIVKNIQKKYLPQLTSSFVNFRSSKIKDDRYDEHGNYHDLSKSVYRTVRMRNSRNLDLNLQRYTSVRKISSESPLDLTFLQHIDPQIIFDLWTKYHVVEYMKSAWRIANDSPIISGTISGVLGGLVVKYFNLESINGKKNKKEKDQAKQEFEKSKKDNGHVLDDLTLRLVDSVLRSNERLEKETDNLRNQVNELSRHGAVLDEEKRKSLENKIAQLQNLSVETRIINDREDKQ